MLANELKPSDRFRMTRHPFSVEYSYDYHDKVGVNGHGLKPDGSMAYITVPHYDTVYKIEEE
jgi:hypothetical protein